MKKKILKHFLIILFGLCLQINFVFAADLKYKMLNEGGFDSSSGNIFTIQDVNIQNSFNYIFNLIIGFSIAIAVVLIAFAGVSKILETFGIKNISPLGKDYKPDFFNPIIGLIIILSMVIILRTLNPDLLTLPSFDNIDFSNMQKSSSTDNVNIE